MPSIVSTDQITDPKKTLAAEIDSALAKFHVFVDFVEVRIPLRYDGDTCDASSEWSAYTPTGAALVHRDPQAAFTVDLEKLAKKIPGIRLHSDIHVDADGSVVPSNVSTPYESVESWVGAVVIKIFPRGNRAQGWGPYVGLKFNPNSLFYGVNAISRVTTIARAYEVGMAAFARFSPALFDLCEIAQARLMRLDWTAGLQVADRAAAYALIRRCADVQSGHIHAAGALPEKALSESIRSYLWSVYFNAESEHHRAVVYYKGGETQKTIERLERDLRTDAADAQAATRLQRLRDADYQNFVEKLVRFEARSFTRGISSLFERRGYPGWDGTVLAALDIEKTLLSLGVSIVKLAWAHVWRPIFTALWGDPDMSIRDVDQLFSQLRDFYARHYADSPRAANSGYRCAQNLINSVSERGFQVVRREIFDAEKRKKQAAGTAPGVSAGIMSSSSWYQTLSELSLAGVSKAMLQSLDGSYTSRIEAGVVISLRSVIECAAVTEIPAWFDRVVGADFDPLSEQPFRLPQVQPTARVSPFSAPSQTPAGFSDHFGDVDHDAGVPYTPTADAVWRGTFMHAGESVADFRARRTALYRAAVERDLGLERREKTDRDAAIAAEWAEMQAARAARTTGSAWYNGASATTD